MNGYTESDEKVKTRLEHQAMANQKALAERYAREVYAPMTDLDALALRGHLLEAQFNISHIRTSAEVGTHPEYFMGFLPSEILSSGFTFNSKRLEIYNAYCKKLAGEYNSLFE